MGCAKLFTATTALIVAAAFVIILSPTITWSVVEQDGDSHKINLWENCFHNGTTQNETCTHYGQPDPYNNIKDGSVKSFRDGAIAGCVFTTLMCLMLLVAICCSSKAWSVTLSLFAAIFATAVIGSWVEFMQHKGKSWDIDPKEVYKTASVGLAIAAAGMVFAWVMFFSSFCISKSNRDKYGELA